MRKTYNAPEMKVVEIQTAVGMLAQSSFDLNSSSDYKVNGSDALSRENIGGWDEEEDFDY